MVRENRKQFFNVYYKNNLARKTNLTRKEAVKHYNDIKLGIEENGIIIYCQNSDSYVDYFKEEFLDLNNKLGFVLYELGQDLLSREGDTLIFTNNMGVNILTNKIVEIKWKDNFTPVIVE